MKDKRLLVSWSLGDRPKFRVYESKGSVNYEPQVDPLGNLEIIKKGEESEVVYLGDAKETKLYCSAASGWVLEFEDIENVNTD